MGGATWASVKDLKPRNVPGRATPRCQRGPDAVPDLGRDVVRCEAQDHQAPVALQRPHHLLRAKIPHLPAAVVAAAVGAEVRVWCYYSKH